MRTLQGGSPSTCAATGAASSSSSAASQVLSLLASLVQKYLLYWYVRRDRASLLQQLHSVAGAQFTCFTGTKVHILTQKKKLIKQSAVHYLALSRQSMELLEVLSLLGLLAQKYKY